ncbi:right-handed parallel beta-helix repeat-containing protein [Arenibacter sp. BSSL-BM3]|uniref:Right-handed parallel beta-helix repeat-containing protein n=1 Tax=Arenibacter arenosicollis TaxID=2762274 RepID=A0ABR7QTP7_9FLAO|nr:right-handed parallel beta-helix repeat-containing protein [Arenibacter arenosicollis]MBC8770444.1 right-handed parallel beta-helix repeat-containing protein [Arenibacter arenosicollis]
MKSIHLLFLVAIFCPLLSFGTVDIYVSPQGKDSNAGSIKAPFASLGRAIIELRKFAGKEPVTVWFKEGTYYLKETVLLGPELSGTSENPIVFSALPGASVTIKGSKLLENLQWREYQQGIFVTDVPIGLDFDQLFVNGERQARARFPNYDYDNPHRGGQGYQQVTGGTDKRYDEWFTYDSKKFTDKTWENPKTGIVHAFQSHNWGNMQYRISGIDRGQNKIFLGEGGWQLQRSYGIGGKGDNASWFYIDNVFEELDVRGEWFLDSEKRLLYYFPEVETDLKNAVIEVPILKDLIQIKGSSDSPVGHISIKGLNFSHSLSTYMDNYEPLARGDWAIHRGGAIFLEGTENCTIEDCNFDYLGGNGVFMSAYNRNNTVSSCQFVHMGESAVCFVGSPSAVRFYQTWDDREIDGKDWVEMRKGMDLAPGPKSLDYPKNCTVQNSIMHDFGDYGKQVAGIFISMSHKITASHNTIYNCPRAGICINDGTWGGHVVEHNDIWETVRETGEHGPFNSWGRERQWLGGGGTDSEFIKEYVKLDALNATIIRNNRIANYRKSISAGNWTIDLDDGSSLYEIYNNLNLGSTIKLRDGMFRKVYNNITVSSVPLGWHVWPKESEDEIYNNIFVISGSVPGVEKPTDAFIRPIRLQGEKWSNNYDYNLYWNVNFPKGANIIQNKTFGQWQSEGYDQHSKIAKPLFVDPENGNYWVEKNSPALELGFKNFPMDKFGHQMTRAVPHGGDFEQEIKVMLMADSRMKEGGSLRYTMDGSEPTKESDVYTQPFLIHKSTIVKSRSFDSDGHALGFISIARFKKVEKVVYPSWLSSLLKGQYIGHVSKDTINALAVEINGAVFVNIADDPDLIDASGGYNFGCFIKNIKPETGKVWLNAGFENDWTIQGLNGEEVRTISDMKRLMEKYKGKKVTFKAVRNYNERQFRLKIE